MQTLHYHINYFSLIVIKIVLGLGNPIPLYPITILTHIPLIICNINLCYIYEFGPFLS